MSVARSTQHSAQPVRRSPAGPRRSHKRQALLNQHVGLVHHVARQLARGLSTEANLDELVSAGSLGLIQAVDSFDESRGLAFSTYAVPRIRGAILDELRRLDSVPRGVRRRARTVSRARHVLVAQLRREPTEGELAHVMAVPCEQLRQWEVDFNVGAPLSIHQPVRSSSGDDTLGDLLRDESAAAPDDALEREDELALVKLAIAGLKEQERTVLALNFYEELKLHEVAAVLGLSVCRISQIRTAALAKLRARLSGVLAA